MGPGARGTEAESARWSQQRGWREIRQRGAFFLRSGWMGGRTQRIPRAKVALLYHSDIPIPGVHAGGYWVGGSKSFFDRTEKTSTSPNASHDCSPSLPFPNVLNLQLVPNTIHPP